MPKHPRCQGLGGRELPQWVKQFRHWRFQRNHFRFPFLSVGIIHKLQTGRWLANLDCSSNWDEYCCQVDSDLIGWTYFRWQQLIILPRQKVILNLVRSMWLSVSYHLMFSCWNAQVFPFIQNNRITRVQSRICLLTSCLDCQNFSHISISSFSLAILKLNFLYPF